MHQLEYEIVVETNPRKGPYGKMPVLRDDQCVIPDSSFILQYLENKYGKLNANLSPKLEAIGLAMQRTIEEHLYFVILYSRWVDKSGMQIIDAAFRPLFPKLIAKWILIYLRRSLYRQGVYQGIARHPIEDVYSQGIADIQAIDTWLADNSYCLGETVSVIDATLFAFLATILLTPLDNPLRVALKQEKRLVDYCDRIRNRYFLDKMPMFFK